MPFTEEGEAWAGLDGTIHKSVTRKLHPRRDLTFCVLVYWEPEKYDEMMKLAFPLCTALGIIKCDKGTI